MSGMRRMLRQESGLTLLELMMTIGIFALLATMAYQFLGANYDFLRRQSDESWTSMQARRAMLQVTFLIREYELVEEDGDLLKAGDEKLIDFSPQEANVSGALLWYDRPTGAAAGRLRNQAGDAIAEGLAEFEKESLGGGFRITIRCVSVEDPYDPGILLSSFVRADRSLP